MRLDPSVPLAVLLASCGTGSEDRLSEWPLELRGPLQEIAMAIPDHVLLRAKGLKAGVKLLIDWKHLHGGRLPGGWYRKSVRGAILRKHEGARKKALLGVHYEDQLPLLVCVAVSMRLGKSLSLDKALEEYAYVQRYWSQRGRVIPVKGPTGK